MTLHNATKFKAGYTVGLEKSGRHCLVVVAKASFNLPTESSKPPTLREEDKQIEIYLTDSFTGEAGYSAPIYENDYAPIKPKCDVILNGSAYSYPEKETTQTVVRLRISSLDKSFRVKGVSFWKNGKAEKPKPFTKQPFSYDTAYGGSDLDRENSTQEEQLYTTFITNPIGQGFYPHCSTRELEGKALAITEELEQQAIYPNHTNYKAQSFGAVARNYYPRYKLGGTYDEYWQEHTRPFLPKDFDEAYYQCTPKEQQIPYPKGGEEIYLKGLTPNGELSFTLPSIDIPMEAIKANGDREKLSPVIDTLTFEPDLGYFTMVYRAKIKLKRSIHEIDTVIVGTPNKLWEKKRLYGECYEEEISDG